MCCFDFKIYVVIEGVEFVDYFWFVVEQYVECIYEYWCSNGKFIFNIIFCFVLGGYIGGGLYYLQNFEGVFMILFGVCIVCLLFVDDVVGLFCISMCFKGFIFYLEFKVFYNLVEVVVVVFEEFEVFFGKVCICCEGIDLIIIIYGNIIYFCLDVVECFVWEGVGSVEVIDFCLLILLDKEVIFVFVWKIGKVMVVYEDKVFFGFGVEIVVQIVGEMFCYLDVLV